MGRKANMVTATLLEDFVPHVTWTQAKSYPDAPHQYVVRTSLPEKQAAQFLAIAKHIRLEGVREWFGNSWYIYYYHNGWKYWTMGAPLDETIILNRAKVDR